MSIVSVVAACVVLSAGVWTLCRDPASSDARTARGLGIVAAVLVVAYAGGMWTIPAVPFFGGVLTRWFEVGMAGLLSLVAAGMAACTVLAWRQRWWGALARAHYSAAALAAAVLVAVARSQGLLPWL
jgi:hypothetical protein